MGLPRRMRTELLERFVSESLAIEGIFTGATPDVVAAHEELVYAPNTPCLEDLQAFLWKVGGDHCALRSRAGMNVMVGRHVAPYGGPIIVEMTENLLREHLDPSSRHLCWPAFDEAIQTDQLYLASLHLHDSFLHIHPFMDGNGRAARALWLRAHLIRGQSLPGFWPGDKGGGVLQTIYYQNLRAFDLRVIRERQRIDSGED